MRSFHLISVLLLSCILSGCAFVPESITLQPQAIPTSSSNIGQGKSVAVSVIDARPQASIGGRPSGYGPAANIGLQNSITQVVHDSIFDGLKSYGFRPVDASNIVSPRQLTLHITGLGYDQRFGLLAGQIKLTSTIEGTAMNKGRTYDQTYRKEISEAILITPTTEQDSRQINNVFSQNIYQILNDQQLFQFLAR